MLCGSGSDGIIAPYGGSIAACGGSRGSGMGGRGGRLKEEAAKVAALQRRAERKAMSIIFGNLESLQEIFGGFGSAPEEGDSGEPWPWG